MTHCVVTGQAYVQATYQDVCVNRKDKYVNFKDILQTIVAMSVVVGLVLGAMAYFAKATDLQLVAQRLDQKIVNDSILDLKKRMWQLEDRNKKKPVQSWPTEDKDEYRSLQHELDQKIMEQKGKK